MCQAYEGEAAAMRRADDIDRQRRYEMNGCMARQAGEPRSDWEKLAYTVRHDVPDGEMHTPSWWMAHWFDGPLIKAWLSGWDREDLRIRAGGGPLSREERLTLSEDISFLGYMLSDLSSAGRRTAISGHNLSRMLRLYGDPDAETFAKSAWEVNTADAVRWATDARKTLMQRLQPEAA